MTVTAFRDRGGGAHFTCQGCGDEVYVACLPDDDPICLTCRFLETVPPEHRAIIAARLKRAGGFQDQVS